MLWNVGFFILGAIIGALVLKNNPKLQKFFNKTADKVEDKVEDKFDVDL